MHPILDTEQAEAIDRAAHLFASVRRYPPPGE
jgi:hypothetical protein